MNGVESEYIMKLSRSGDAYFSAGDGASDVVGWATPDGIHSNQSSIPASPLVLSVCLFLVLIFSVEF